MKRFLTASVAVFAAPSPAVASAQATPAEEAVIQAFLQFDCVMTRETEDAVVAAMGLSEEAAETAGQALFAQGMFQEINGELVMQHPDCPNAGAPAAPTESESAVERMTALGPEQAANVLAEIMAARGCAIAPDDFGRFQGELAAAIGQRFAFDETALLPDAMDPFLDALEGLGDRGMIQLVREGRLEDGADGRTLVACDGTGQ